MGTTDTLARDLQQLGFDATIEASPHVAGCFIITASSPMSTETIRLYGYVHAHSIEWGNCTRFDAYDGSVSIIDAPYDMGADPEPEDVLRVVAMRLRDHLTPSVMVARAAA